MKVLIIDNYDSFTYNLYQYVGEILSRSTDYSLQSTVDGRQKTVNNFIVDVVRNDQITITEIKKRNYDKIILSPGPGDPMSKKDFGISMEVIEALHVPILGVCLGHQGIAACFGGNIIQATHIMHGVKSRIVHSGKGIFTGIPQGFTAMRYHSLVADPQTLPECLEVTAVVTGSTDYGLQTTVDGSLKTVCNMEIMGLRHKTRPLYGVQFHPESIGTAYGKKILKNFLIGR